MNDYKYTLIISQYYHSYHYFIAKFNKETFINQMQKVTKELDKYKGAGTNDKHAITESDPFYKFSTPEIHRRYNVNGNGDIYFINSTNANYLQEFIQKDIYETKISRQGFKKRAVLDAINENHNYNKVSKIIQNYFEIA